MIKKLLVDINKNLTLVNLRIIKNHIFDLFIQSMLIIHISTKRENIAAFKVDSH